jgi:signal transduction histidine kinase/DNA-binding response OmpR family regulator
METDSDNYHQKFHRIVANISSGFIGADTSNIDDKIDDMLSKIIDIFSLDRGYLFLFSQDRRYMTNTHEKCANGVTPVKEMFLNIEVDKYPWWLKQIESREYIQILNVDDMPDEAQAEKQLFKKMDIISLVAVPVIINNMVAGFLGLDATREQRSWDIQDINLLQILANTIAESQMKIAAEREVRRLARMQQMIMNIAKTYINIPLKEVNNSIMESLREMAEFVEADRSYIFDYDFKNRDTSNTFEWCAEGISPEIENLQNVPIDYIPDWINKHSQGEDFNVTDVLSLPHEGPGCLRDILEPQGIKSIITVPMIDGDDLIGFVGFDSVKKHHKYTDKEKSLLTLFAQMLVNVKKRAHAERMLLDAKEQAEAANRAKSEFLANMSHEIRTPLNSVIGFTELLNRTPLNLSQKKFVENANISAQSLLEIINDILDFSKIEAGKLELSPIKTDIIEIAEQVCEMVKYQANQKGLELLLNIDPETPRYAVVDPIRLKQILVNLISNGIKFTESGEVELSLRFEKREEPRGVITFQIRDTGIGITQDEQKKLFKAFTQADSSTTRKFGGTGLGLVISNHLAEKMGDKIHMESEHGKGSRFFFSVETQIDYREKIGGSILNNVKRVLVVDDNRNNRTILEQTLRNWDIEVVTCEDGLEAIRIIKLSDPFDVLIIDFKMPLINGIDTIRMLRADSSLEKEKFPVILMCSSDDDSLINEECRNSGMIYKLIKPVKIRELHEYLLNLSKTGVINGAEKESKRSSYSKSNFALEGTMITNPKIMIAEDVQMNMILIKTLVNSYLDKATIFEARNGREAVKIAAQESPDIILMDVQMPEMDGLEATREIRIFEASNGGHIPIIALTAGVSKEDRESCSEAGMDGFLTKPIEQKELHKLLRSYLTAKNVSNLNNEDNRENMENGFLKRELTAHFNRNEMMQRVDNNPDVLADLLTSLNIEMEEAILQLKESLINGNSDQSRKINHKIKGIALNMSFGKLSEIVNELETSIIRGRGDKLILFQNMSEEWNTLKRIIY